MTLRRQLQKPNLNRNSKKTHLIEDHAKFGPNKAVDQKIDGGVDHKEYVREKPDKGDDGSIGYDDGDVITLMLMLMFMMVMFFIKDLTQAECSTQGNLPSRCLCSGLCHR